MKHKGILFTGFVVGLVALVLMFIFTDPVSVGLFGVSVIFTIIYYMIFCIIYWVSIVFYTTFRRGKKMNSKKILTISAILAAAPVVIMSFLSLGGVSTPELILVALMVVVAIFFANRKM